MKKIAYSFCVVALCSLLGCASEPMSAIWYDKSYQTLKSPGDENIVVSKLPNSVIAVKAFDKNYQTHFKEYGVPFRLVVVNGSKKTINFDLSNIRFSQANNTQLALVTADEIADGNDAKVKRMAFFSMLGSAAIGLASATSKNTDSSAVQKYIDTSSQAVSDTAERAMENNEATFETLFKSQTLPPGATAGGVVVIKNVDLNGRLYVLVSVGGDHHRFSLTRHSFKN
ncbi:hypothetical protein N5C67_25465 [Comamonas thiooxydans]|uniref:hypothetical protein n=1 Tax=Comamonas thiooxydans TaxID=363952 RepID=UPI00244AC0EA|nr:hypothetical protein [Comamonas thiooxydans]MDH1255990.1 hypothetical protein [Comamonas thiooxydans]